MNPKQPASLIIAEVAEVEQLEDLPLFRGQAFHLGVELGHLSQGERVSRFPGQEVVRGKLLVPLGEPDLLVP